MEGARDLLDVACPLEARGGARLREQPQQREAETQRQHRSEDVQSFLQRAIARRSLTPAR